jgi:hypothetical protein
MAVEKKKVTFKGVSTEQVVKQYKRTRLLSYALYALVVFFVMTSLNFFSVDRLTAVNLVLCLATAAFAIYVLHNIGQNMLAKYLEILRHDCDPYKFEALYSRMERRPDKPNKITFNICRALFYQGRFQEAYDRLKAMGRPSEKSVLYFQYYNLMASCCDELGDVEKLVMIKEKIGRQVLTMSDKDKFVGNGRQLQVVLEQMLSQKEGRLQRSRSLAEEILDQAAFPLARIQATARLAALEYQCGAGRSAMEHAAYVIDDGGRTFYVDRAREIYKNCCGKDYLTEAEQFQANLEAGAYEE